MHTASRTAFSALACIYALAACGTTAGPVKPRILCVDTDNTECDPSLQELGWLLDRKHTFGLV